MTTVLVEVIVPDDGRIVLNITAPSGAGLEFDLEPDEARDLVNMLGGAIRAASRTGAMT